MITAAQQISQNRHKVIVILSIERKDATIDSIHIMIRTPSVIPNTLWGAETITNAKS